MNKPIFKREKVEIDQGYAMFTEAKIPGAPTMYQVIEFTNGARDAKTILRTESKDEYLACLIQYRKDELFN